MIGEVRDTLYDLRTDVSDKQALAPVLELFAHRVAERSGLAIEVHCDQDARLPAAPGTRDVAHRPGGASSTSSATPRPPRPGSCGAATAGPPPSRSLDNGKGFPSGTVGRFDSYGILGMRERASSIGATVEVASSSGRGTRVRCLLQQGN